MQEELVRFFKRIGEKKNLRYATVPNLFFIQTAIFKTRVTIKEIDWCKAMWDQIDFAIAHFI